MIEPEIAPVTPRVIWPETGDAVPIDEIFRRMEGKPVGAIEITGNSGSGKTTALRYLAAKAPPDQHIAWVDDANFLDVVGEMKDGWVIYTTGSAETGVACPSFALAGWGDDERIEYLLARHPDQCQSVIARLGRDSDRSSIGDTPRLWRIVLDQMAEHESIHSVDDALWCRLVQVLPERDERRLSEELCLAMLVSRFDHAEKALRELLSDRGEESLRLVWARPAVTLLAADYLARWLETSQSGAPLLPVWDSLLARLKARLIRSVMLKKTSRPVLPKDVVAKTAQQIAASPRAIARLREILSGGNSQLHSLAASVLHALNIGWIPERRSGLCLNEAFLAHAIWPGIDLREMQINEADLSGSNLARAQLDHLQARGTHFCGASLSEARLVKISAQDADFTEADLSHANLQNADLAHARLVRARLGRTLLRNAVLRSTDLTNAHFASASMRQALLHGAMVDGTDFTFVDLAEASLPELDLRTTRLDGASLAGANLEKCNLEGMRLMDVNFTAANLTRALLSGSVMQGGTMREAILREAGLADIQWEGADLRDADLRGAIFHLGSSRSGLVDSPLASEGTRTGFYTDDFDEQTFQSPEQIRKANLHGADLRGANIEGVDFYLVDLRAAKYDPEQLEHFRQCRAILADRE